MNAKTTATWAALAALGIALSVASAQEVGTRAVPDAAKTEAAKKAMAGFKHPEGTTVKLFAAEPLLAGPVAFDVDYDGRVYVAETDRFEKGVGDNRANMFWYADDLAAQTVADRAAYYKKWIAAGKKTPEWFTDHYDQVRRITDTDGDGAADESHVLARFNDPLDGVGSGILADRGDLYYTNIPHLWKLRDGDNDGKAEVRESLSTGYGVRSAYLGHDLHGLTWGPDGKLYFTIGDRGFNITTPDGRNLRDPMDVGRGAVFRCNRDGSGLEVYAWGLRNPQELAFDDYGNLWTVDNNADKGDKARLVYVIEQGDSGWAMPYQTLEGQYNLGPFGQEMMWTPRHAGQPAWINPPIANISSGPSGFVHYPGLGLPEKYKGHFFLCDFRANTGNSGIHAFATEPDGAGFRIKGSHLFWWHIVATDVDFGYDGKMYASDWLGGWTPRGQGRMYTLQHDEAIKDPRIAATAKLVREGFDRRGDEELIKLLGHADRRVRLQAQFELARRDRWGAMSTIALDEKASRLSRIHAIWGMAVSPGLKPDVKHRIKRFGKLINNADPEIRAQALRAVAWLDWFPHDGIVRRIGDEDSRVRYFAAMAAGRFKIQAAVEPVITLLRENDDKDVYLRHAAVVAFSRIGDADAVLKFADDESRAVRMGVLLTLRRMGDARIARFLADEDRSLVIEAARAIHDLPIAGATDALADMLGGDLGPLDESRPTFALHRRVYNAAFRRGTATDAARLAAYTADAKNPHLMRRETMKALREFASPNVRDFVLGFHRPLPQREPGIVTAAIQPHMKAMLEGDLKGEATALAVQYRVPLDRKAMIAQVADENSPATFRIAALRALREVESKPELGEFYRAIQTALESNAPELRAEGIDLYSKHSGEESSVEPLRKALATGTLIEKQRAVSHLYRFDGLGFKAMAQKLGDGTLDPALRLDVYNTAISRPDIVNVPAVAAITAKLAAADLATLTSLTTDGGDAEKGKALFLGHAAAQCQRCHKVDGVGGEAGPDLSAIGKLRDRAYLVRALVAPQAEVAEGYGTISVTLKDGTTHAGIVRSDADGTLTLLSPDGKPVAVAVSDIASRTPPISAMPPMGFILKPHELRDVVAYLATLQTEPKAGGAHGK